MQNTPFPFRRERAYESPADITAGNVGGTAIVTIVYRFVINIKYTIR
jgi:hypothetical protein